MTEPTATEVSDDDIVLQAVGDVALIETDGVQSVFRDVEYQLKDCDILYGNCEAQYPTTRGIPGPVDGPVDAAHVCGDDCRGKLLASAGFQVMSCANNHFGDHGRDGVLRTTRMLRYHGIATAGAGPSPEEARSPAILNAKGRKVGFISYTGVRDPKGRTDIPEIANFHATTNYVNVEPNQPGCPPRIETKMVEEDLQDIRDSIRRARSEVDLLVMAFHWGVHHFPFVTADYERELGHAAIDAGADAVLGCHQHILNAVEIYRGRPIFYGFGNFSFYHRPVPKEQLTNGAKRYGEYRKILAPDPEQQWSTRPERNRVSMIGRIVFPRSGDPQVSIIPSYYDNHHRPKIDPMESPKAVRVLEYLRECNEVNQISTELEVEAGRIRVCAKQGAEPGVPLPSGTI